MRVFAPSRYHANGAGKPPAMHLRSERRDALGRPVSHCATMARPEWLTDDRSAVTCGSCRRCMG